MKLVEQTGQRADLLALRQQRAVSGVIREGAARCVVHEIHHVNRMGRNHEVDDDCAEVQNVFDWMH